MPVGTQRADEGRRVLRNVASFCAFLLTPLQIFVLSHALGPAGYGHWWWTFGLLEAAMLLGHLGAELYVRREVPQHAAADRREELPAIVGSGLAVVGVAGLGFTMLQLALAQPLASAQHDAGLLPFLLLLAIQPVLLNATGILIAALQSLDVIGSIAVVRGIVMPLVQIGLLYLAWQVGASVIATILLLLGVTVLGLVVIAVIYARHLALGATLRAMMRPRYTRAVLRYGFALLVPSVLFTIAGKLDVYVLGAHVDAPMIGVYAGCLSAAAMLPATRALFDPIVQAQIGALHGADDGELRASLARMTRLCMLALAPPLVFLVAVGEPFLQLLLGHPVPFAVTPLAILCVGQLIGSLAIAGWLVPMSMAGRELSLIALATLGAKILLLFALVPHFGILGAAIATAVGTVVAQQGQVLFAARRLGYRPYAASLLPLLAASIAVAIGGRGLFELARDHLTEASAAILAGVVALAVLFALITALLEPSERAALRRLV